jgi:hypothetical protein
MAESRDLPDDLKALVQRNALPISHDRFRTDSERLEAAVKLVLEKTAAERLERLEAEKRQREEQVRLAERLEAQQTERRKTESKERLEAESLEALRRQLKEKERLRDDQLDKEALESGLAVIKMVFVWLKLMCFAFVFFCSIFIILIGLVYAGYGIYWLWRPGQLHWDWGPDSWWLDSPEKAWMSILFGASPALAAVVFWIYKSRKPKQAESKANERLEAARQQKKEQERLETQRSETENKERRAPQRGSDLRYDLYITSQEAFSGVEKLIEILKFETCKSCGGSGALKSGNLLRRIVHRCQECGGDGRVERRSQINLKVPAGIDDGASCVLTGEAMLEFEEELQETCMS